MPKSLPYGTTIESFFKLLKQAGHQLESWQQESGLALAKRLLLANCPLAMARSSRGASFFNQAQWSPNEARSTGYVASIIVRIMGTAVYAGGARKLPHG